MNDSVAAAVSDAPKPKPIPLVLPSATYKDAAKWITSVPLKFGPYICAGREWTEIYLRRLTVDQIAAYQTNFDENRKRDPDFKRRIPMYIDESGKDVPEELFGVMFDDDLEDVETAAFLLLPRRFRSRMNLESPESISATESSGDTTSTSSSFTSAEPAPNA